MSEIKEGSFSEETIEWALKTLREKGNFAAANVLTKEYYGVENEQDEDGNLVQHAKRELELIGEDEQLVGHILEMVRTFSAAGHSGYSAMYTVQMLTKLLSFQNLLPLTDRPEEWFEHEDGAGGTFWQNIRNGEAFSRDGGKTYYLLSEGGNDRNPDSKMHESVKFKPEETEAQITQISKEDG